LGILKTMRTVAEALANLQRTSETPLLSKLGRLFSDAGFELALVGGPVRDAFLGRVTNDLDFTTSALSLIHI
jgi:poly(A) polymerase